MRKILPAALLLLSGCSGLNKTYQIKVDGREAAAVVYFDEKAVRGYSVAFNGHESGIKWMESISQTPRNYNGNNFPGITQVGVQCGKDELGLIKETIYVNQGNGWKADLPMRAVTKYPVCPLPDEAPALAGAVEEAVRQAVEKGRK